MSDLFADVDASSPELIGIITTALEIRAADPDMLPVIDAYLDRLGPPEDGLIVDIGCGTGGMGSCLRHDGRNDMAPFRKADGSIGFGARARYLVATPA